MSVSDMIAVEGIALAIQATYLAVLLPLFYTLVGVLLRDIPDDALSIPILQPYAQRIIGYYASADTLINWAAALWLADIVVGFALVGGFLLNRNVLYVSFGSGLVWIANCVAVGFAFFAWFIIYTGHRDLEKRDYNVFCVPSTGWTTGGRANVIRGILLSAISIALATTLAVLFLLRIPLQPRPDKWTPHDITLVLSTGGIVATISLVGWLALGWHFQPFAALSELRRLNQARVRPSKA